MQEIFLENKLKEVKKISFFFQNFAIVLPLIQFLVEKHDLKNVLSYLKITRLVF